MMKKQISPRKTTTQGTVYLIRHAQSKGNIDTRLIQGRSNHLEITELGKRQAAFTGKWLKDVYGTPDFVVASPAVRTRRTAELALEAAGLQLPIAIDTELQELSQGIWEGAVRSEKWTPQVMQCMHDEGLDYRSPGGESSRDVQMRMVNAVSALAEGTTWGFSHGYAIRCLVGDMLRWDQPQILEARYQMYNTSVTEFDRTKSGLSLGRFALAEHLSSDMLTI